MQKITELSEARYRTVREKDAVGNKVVKQVAYTAFREVNVISGGKRFAHAFVDSIVYYVIYYFFEYVWISISASNKDPLNTFVSGFFISVLFIFSFPIYYILFEHFLQKTPGKFLTKCVVIDIYGNKPEIGTNILRNIIRLVPFEIFSCLFSSRGWHDRWSDTYVVSDEEYLKIKELQFVEQIDSNIGEAIENIKPPVTKRITHIFLFIILPLSFILYIGIIYKSFTKAKELLNNPEILKKFSEQKEVKSEANEITDISIMYNNGHIDEAQKKLVAFTKVHKDYHLAWTILGHTYFDQDNYQKAIEAYTKGVRANKNSFDPHNGLGMAFTALGEYEKAKRELRIADSLEPNNSGVFGNLANLYDEMGDIQKSVVYGEKSVQLDSTNATLCANLSYYYHKNKQYRKSDLMFIKTEQLGYESMEALSQIVYPTNETEGFVQVSGTISDGYTNAHIEGVQIEVFNKDSTLIREIFTDDEGKYKFVLPINVADINIVKVSYPEFIHKYFTVNTEKVPLKGWENKTAKIVADISLSEKLKGVDYSFLNKPLNNYFFNPAKNNFDSDIALLEASIKKLETLKIIEKKIKQKK